MKGDMIMANYTTTFSSGRTHNQVKEFVVDTKAQLDKIDISQILAGSKAFVIKENGGQWYMLDHEGHWNKVNLGSGGGSSGGEVIYNGGDEDDPDDTNIIYNGGDEDDSGQSNNVYNGGDEDGN